ncbi:MAG: hypothetical protein WBA23_25360 [Tunicatimonas sp.]|uniref:hypothetical protein n=1 Tax=Tunicatimonas sp. TaxID=1940096 RepID=UPI003C76A95E
MGKQKIELTNSVRNLSNGRCKGEAQQKLASTGRKAEHERSSPQVLTMLTRKKDAPKPPRRLPKSLPLIEEEIYP